MIQDVEIYPDYRGISIIGSYRLLEFNGIRAALLTEIDHEEAMEPIIQIRNELLVLLVILLVFLLIISAGFAQILSRPIFKLKNISRQLSRGELPSSLPSSGFIFELSEITKSFHQLIDLGFDCILTSGQKEKAEEGIENLISWNTKFGSDIIIMPGSGVGISNCKKFKKAGFKYIHLSAGEDLKPIPMPDGINQNLSFLKQKIRHSDKQTLIEVVKSIKSVE